VNRRHPQANPVLNPLVLVRTAVGLQLLGVDVQPALKRIDLAPEQLGYLGDEIPLHKLRDFWEAVVETTGQSGLGLRIAEYVHPEAYEVFGCLIAASATLGEATLRATRLIGLVTSTVRLSFHHEGDRASLSVDPLYPELVHPETIEFMVGAAAVISQRITGQALPAIEVCFTHAAPADVSHHKRIFGAPIRFGAAFNGLVFAASLLDVPIQSSDSTLCATLQRQADELMARESVRGFKASVRAALVTELRGGDPSAERVAAALGVHPKTLTRRLRAEGSTFQRLREELRLQLAERYLRQPGLSVEEVAFLLGYSERSAFHRAFRRWTGRAPRAADVG
jgi:AraC-like DNA-binding protein